MLINLNVSESIFLDTYITRKSMKVGAVYRPGVKDRCEVGGTTGYGIYTIHFPFIWQEKSKNYNLSYSF